MDLDLREAFDQGFGPEPPHRPVSDRIEGGQRAVRRRRLVGSVLTVAVAAVLGLSATSLLDDGPDRTTQVADDPTVAPGADSWPAEEPARYTDDGTLEIRPAATVLQRLDDPLGDPTADHRSVALALEYQGTETWLILGWQTEADDSTSTSVTAVSPTGGTFADWVDATAEPPRSYLSFAADGSLVAGLGVTIVEQRHPVHLENFVLNGEPTAAALLRGPDGKKWYVVARLLDGEVDSIAVPFRMGGPDLDAFLAYAREKYGEGVGLR
jgi:hypothetical protein